MKRLLLLLPLTLWPAPPVDLPMDIQLAYLEASLDVANARVALLTAQEHQSEALIRANLWCPVKLVGNRLKCQTTTTPMRIPLPPQLPASSMSGGGK